MRSYLTERFALASVRVREKLTAKWNDLPFGMQPKASHERYLEILEAARSEDYPTADAIEREVSASRP